MKMLAKIDVLNKDFIMIIVLKSLLYWFFSIHPILFSGFSGISITKIQILQKSEYYPNLKIS